MGDYGACDHIRDLEAVGNSVDNSADGEGKPGTMPPRLRPGGRLFLENPDGTITEGIPSGDATKEKVVEDGRRNRTSTEGDSDTDGSLSEAAVIHMTQELEHSCSQHEFAFMFLLAIQLFFEILYSFVYMLRLNISVIEVVAMYNYQVRPWMAYLILGIIFALQLVYVVASYVLATIALYTRKPKCYQHYSNWSVIGIVGLVFLAYADKFNLPLFFLRLLAYIYSRYLQGLSASLMLLPAMSPS